MYAVIKTGGKQYRVQAGDMLVVEKLEGEPGAEVRFDQVLMVGDEAGAEVGAPLVANAAVTATLIETRKGEKVKIFKKIRRQGYRRTRGHRQPETVLRVTGLSVGAKTESWDGVVDLTPLAVLNARARGLAPKVDLTPAGVEVETLVLDASREPEVHAAIVEHADAEPAAKAPKAAKARKAKADAAPTQDAEAQDTKAQDTQD